SSLAYPLPRPRRTKIAQPRSPPLITSTIFIPTTRLPGDPQIRASTDRHLSKQSFQVRLLSLQGWGLTDLLLRASNEGLPRPRVARAQKIIRLYPLLSVPD